MPSIELKPSRDTSATQGHIRDTSFNPCATVSITSVSNNSRPIEGHKGHILTTYGCSTKNALVMSETLYIERNCSKATPLSLHTPMCDELSTGGHHAH